MLRAKKSFFVLGALMIASFSGAAGLSAEETKVERKVDEASQAAKTTLFDWIDKDTVTVNFKSGKSEVSASERSDIKALVDSAAKRGKIEKVIVVAWSDKAYPDAEGEAPLSGHQVNLASKRASNLEAVLKADGVKSIETHKMTERPLWIASTFLNTDDAKFKGEGKINNAKDQTTVEIGNRLRAKGGAGTAVVLVKLVGHSATH